MGTLPADATSCSCDNLDESQSFVERLKIQPLFLSHVRKGQQHPSLPLVLPLRKFRGQEELSPSGARLRVIHQKSACQAVRPIIDFLQIAHFETEAHAPMPVSVVAPH